mmetsp:Transcript_18622/g.20747  ORF Transcript_18622/g.20747 Transcript_18622/m.20747 type:complete len:260 (-) Transcript_18622:29-808(-)
MRSYLSRLQVKALFLSSAVCFSEAVRPFPSSSNPMTRQALELRGGSTPMKGAAKAVTTLGLAVGTTTALSTKTVLDKIGIENMDPMGVLTTRRIGVSILCFSLVAYCLVFQNTSVSTAVGVSCIPTVVEIFKALFDGAHKELGFPAEGQVVVGLVFAVFSYLFLNDSPLSKDALLKIYSGWLLSHGVLMGCFPSLALKTYGGMDAKPLMVLQSIVSLWGFSLLSLGALSGCLAAGMMTTKALALSTLPFLSRFAFSKFV